MYVNPEASSAVRYRPDIDGLRAVAVILVILYHLDRSLAPGGFVGVDIFFVISGFVVTGSVLASTARGPFTAVMQFWRRRILRIIPAVLLTVVVTTIMLALFIPPFPGEVYDADIRTGISGLFGLANLYLYRSSQNYFSADQSANPFVHMWSLGVEEQFYFAFALGFLGVIGFIRHDKTRLGVSVGVMSLLGVASYCGFLVTAQTNPSITYYSITFRFWEIAAGSLLAYIAPIFSKAFRPKHFALSIALQIVAVLALAKVIWLDRPSGFPTGPISIAVGCAALLIVTGQRSGTPINRILSVPIFVKIGLISFSLYLWHYPVFSFFRTNVGLDTAPHIVLSLMVTILIALFSYWVVELRLRHSKAPFARVVLPCMLGFIIVLSGCTWLLQRHPGALYVGSSQLWSKDWEPLREFARQGQFPYSGRDRIVGTICEVHDGIVPDRIPDQCFSATESNADRKKTTLLVIGDSHAYADWGMAASGADMKEFRFATFVHDGCGPGGEPSTRARSCNAYWNGLPAMVRETLRERDRVLIAVFWPGGEFSAQSKSSWLSRAGDAINNVVCAARDRGAEVIIEAPLPTFDRPAYLCTKEWYRSNYEGCSVNRSEVERHRNDVLTQLRAIAQEHGNVRVWDPLPLLCPTETCSQFQDDKPLFRDTNHLSYYGSKWLAPAFVGFLRETKRYGGPHVYQGLKKERF
jgi:peptidoglycan/LPS O-acetylase OafA/YrhL